MTQEQERLARLERKWAQIPKDTIARFVAALAAQIDRVIEGDRPRQDYIAKAKAAGNTIAVELAETLAKSDLYDDAGPERMPTYVAGLAPIPRGRGRERTWSENHHKRMDDLRAQGHTPTMAARIIAKQDGVTLAGEELKKFVDARVKAWRKSSPERKRQK